MGKYDSSIRWLWEQIGNSLDRLTEIRRGHRTKIDDQDVTDEQKASYTHRVKRYLGLIRDYERRDD